MNLRCGTAVIGLTLIVAMVARAEDATWRVHLIVNYEHKSGAVPRYAEGNDYVVLASSASAAQEKARKAIEAPLNWKVGNVEIVSTDLDADCGTWTAEVEYTYRNRSTGKAETERKTLEIKAKDRKSAEKKAQSPVNPWLNYQLTRVEVKAIASK
jgi:hypothetical protein